MSHTFTCPNCHEHRLEEVMINVTVSSVIKSISKNGCIEYGEQTNDDGEVTHYQCVNCGYIPKLVDGNGHMQPVADCLDLVTWLDKQGNHTEDEDEDEDEQTRRDEKNGLYPDKEDVSN